MMKKGTRYIQAQKKKAHEYAMHIYADHPDLSCRALQALLENQGYTVDHTTV